MESTAKMKLIELVIRAKYRKIPFDLPPEAFVIPKGTKCTLCDRAGRNIAPVAPELGFVENNVAPYCDRHYSNKLSQAARAAS